MKQIFIERCLILWLFLACAILFGGVTAGDAADKAAAAGKWTFVVFGDTRDDTKESRTGISAILPALAMRIANEKPDFVIFNGDMINGYWTTPKSPMHGKYREMFGHWIEATKPIRDAGIPLYIVRGNHEYGGEVQDGGVPELMAAFREIIASKNPQNGPADAKGLTYSFAHKSGFFVITDQYVGSKGHSVNIDLPWITGQIEGNTKPYVFTFGHSPAFHVTKSSDETEYQLFNLHDARDRFWKLHVKHGVIAYIASHEHFYTRGKKDNVFQIVQGNGGASPFNYSPKEVDESLSQVFPTVSIHKADVMPGFLVVTIDDQARTITATEKCMAPSGSLTVFDQFSLYPR